MTRPKAFDGLPPKLECAYGPYAAVSNKVHDGDSVLVTLSLGVNEYPVVWLRLKTLSGEWVGAPELSETGGPETRAFVANLLPYETPMRVRTQKTPRSHAQEMSITRYVGTVEILDDTGAVIDLGAKVNEFVKAHGYGRGKT